MIYLVSLYQDLFNSTEYEIITVEKSLEIMKNWDVVQADSETSGKDPHISKLLCFQFGNKEGTIQIVVDCSTIDIRSYKHILEEKYLIFQNGKFDLQFLYNYHIIPRKIYDTMIVEQLLYLGYPSGIAVSKEEYNKYNYTFPYHESYNEKTLETIYTLSYALDAIVQKRLHKHLDKTVRGEIIWRGLDERVILYAAKDVQLLYAIAQSQMKDCREKGCTKGAKLECDFVPVIAYLEWCGIKLDENKWKAKMKSDKEHLEKATKALNDYVVSNPKLKKFTWIDTEGNLWTGYDLTPKCTVNWSSSRQVCEVAKVLGFNVVTQDKKTGKDKESVLEKFLKMQKGIDDKFLELYFDYQEADKVVSSFGQGHLNAINPNTGRIHTVYRQLGASSGRMSCGSQQPNTELAKLKGLMAKECTFPNMQQLPSDEITRASFVANKDNLLVDCDFSALESRLGADIYKEKAMQEEFLHGSGDMHSLCAKMVFSDELKDVDVKDIKSKRPDLRKKVKPIELNCEDSL